MALTLKHNDSSIDDSFRRFVPKSIVFAIAACCLLAGDLAGLSSVAYAQKPNIVLFLVDDMGWQDTSVEFHTERTVWNDLYNTPNMERLAAQGMKFTNAYSASPVCSPTRTSIMTGQNPARSRVSDWVGHGRYQNSVVKAPAWKENGLLLSDAGKMLPTILGNNGYRTAHVGKAHFGNSTGEDPTNLGFDINIAGSRAGSPTGNGSGGRYFGPFPASTPGLGAYGEGDYLTDVLTIEANKIIEDAVTDDVPFFINLAHYAVHAPITGQGDPQFVGQYQNTGRPANEVAYAAMIASMDKSLGSVLDKLESEGIADNTLVIFMSDNGGLSQNSRGSSNGTVTVQTVNNQGVSDGSVSVNFSRHEHNTPLRSGKGSGSEGGVRVPMMFAWAGQDAGQIPINSALAITPNSTEHTPVISDDLFTTILNVADVTNLSQYTHAQGGKIVDGVDLTSLLTGEGTFERDGNLVFHYPHQWHSDVGIGPSIEPYSAIRVGDHKLLYFYGDGKKDGIGADPRFELFNLADDLGETTDLAGSKENLKRLLSNKLVEYLIEVDAQVPEVRSTGLPAELPEIFNLIGDLTDDGEIDLADWLVFRGALNTNISAANLEEAEGQGDFNFDLVVDRHDFLTFKTVYNEVNGAGALAKATSVPEPSTLVLLLLSGLAVVVRCKS